MARAIKLIDAPIGLFEVDGILVLKTEYSTRHEDGTITPDCYIIESGEYFWGGVDSVEERNNLEVAPVDMPTLTPPNEPLTIEELRGMDGQPVYWPDDESWGIVSVDDAGRWAGIPFFRGRKNGVNFEYDIVSRGMEVYAYPPAHIDREKWTAEWVDNDHSEEMMCKCSKCGYPVSYFWGKTAFCPGCGRAMTPEAWAELERRVFGEV